MCCHTRPSKMRTQLLEATVLPSLMWGLATVWMKTREKGTIRSVQRIMVACCLHIFARPHDTHQDFHRRRERVVTVAIHRHCRARWESLQLYRVLNFGGHVVRLSDDHMVGDALRWRGLQWWTDFRSRSPVNTRGQHGRRPRDCGNPCITERSIARLADAWIRTEAGQRECDMAVEVQRALVVSWDAIALSHDAHTEFSKWGSLRARRR